jgi:hypothetical protein
MKLFLLPVAATMLIAASGCTSKSTAEARAREAYAAGQRDAVARTPDPQRTSIRFIGPVQNTEVAWVDGLTLAHAISAAGYTEARDPATIVIYRQRGRIPFDPADLLRGKDFELQPGDSVEIHP